MKTGSSQDILQTEIEQLQIKVAYQEHTIESLNDEVTRQNKQIEKLAYQLAHVMEKLQGLQPSNVAKASEETPPPHY